MIKIVHLSSNPVSGSPFELNKLLNTYSTKIQSRLIQGTASYRNDNDIPQRTFPFDLIWNENKEECIKLIQEADILHIHNSLFPDNLREYIKPNQKIILQLYSVYREKLQDNINKTLELNPIITIADQTWQKEVYVDLSKIYLPLVKTDFQENTKKDVPIILYAPTNKLPISHIYSKGYYEILEILYRLKQKYNFELKIIEGLNYIDNLKEKHNADIIIDDIINKNAFHGTSLEAACYGAVALTNYSGEDYPFKKTDLNTLESILNNYLNYPDSLKHDKNQFKEWQQKNYNVEILTKKYEDFYESCIQNKETLFENITDPHEKSERMTFAKSYLLNLMTDWLEKYNIPYFLSFGSALKAYRDREHALDADLGLFYEDKWKVKKLLENNLPSEIMINCMWRGEITFRLKDSSYPKLDFIFFDKQKDFYQCNIYSKNPLNHLITWERGLKISHEVLNSFQLIEFNNKKFPIPKNIELYLDENYTEEWKIPIPNKTYGWGSRPCADKDHRQVAIIVPTFIRPQKVKNCIESILNTYPDGMVRIYVGDQSDIIIDEMQEFYNKLEVKGHRFFRLPYNCGLAYARNYLIKQLSTEPYVLIIDDDFIFTVNTALSKFIDVLEEKENHGICGGNLEGRHHYAGWLSYHPAIQKIFKIDIFSVPQSIQLTASYPYRNRKVSYYYSDSVLNFFLAKKEVFQDIQWDDNLPLVEHSVTKDTPIFIKDGRDNIKSIPINKLFPFYPSRPDKKRHIFAANDKIKIWSDIGWQKVIGIFKHKIKKEIYFILTNHGYIECTEDHSLIVNNKKIKPANLKIGDSIELCNYPPLSNKFKIDKEWAWLLGLFLAEGCYCKENALCNIANQDLEILNKSKRILHKFAIDSHIVLSMHNKSRCNYLNFKPFKMIDNYFSYFYIDKEKIIPSFIFDFDLDSRKSFFEGFMIGDGFKTSECKGLFSQKSASIVNGLFYLLHDIYPNRSIAIKSNQLGRWFVGNLKQLTTINKNVIKKITHKTIIDEVYDVETENHHFCGGIGNINLHNTDFMLRLKNTKWQVCYVPEVTIQHSTIPNENDYKQFRHQDNKKIGIERFCKKWNLNSLDDIWRFPFQHVENKEQEVKELEIIKNTIDPNIDVNGIFREITELLDKENIFYCLLNTTCKDVVVQKNILASCRNLYFGAILNEKIIKTFQQLGYSYEGNCLSKNGVIILFEELPKQTKRWNWNNKIYNVPFPLVMYLTNKFGIDLKHLIKK